MHNEHWLATLNLALELMCWMFVRRVDMRVHIH